MDRIFSSINEVLDAAFTAASSHNVSASRPVVPADSAEIPPLEILWVDDDPFHLGHVGGVLRDLGWHVTTAPSADDAMSMVQLKKFDGLVTDLLMPAGLFGQEETSHGMRTGLVLAERVRKMFPRMPVAFVTVAIDDRLSRWCSAHPPAGSFGKSDLSSEQVKSLDSLMRHGTTSTAALQEWLGKFGLLSSALSRRFDGRPGIVLDDEYDVQDVIHALLLMRYPEIRREEWTPSYAGGSSRIDFVIPSIRTAVEVKMAMNRTGAKRVGEELLVDVARYKTHPTVGSLVCFIVDASAAIKSPAAFATDLRAASSSSLQVSAMIWSANERPSRALQPTSRSKRKEQRRPARG